MLIVALFACGGAPAPTGTLVYVEETDGVARTARRTLPGGAAARVPGLVDMTYPGPPDPQQTHLVVVSAVDGDAGHRETLSIAPLAGGPVTALAPTAEVVRVPAWSPDGAWLVFESSERSFRDIYRVNRDGTGLARLTDAEHGSFEPSIAPDGSRVVFASSRDGNAEIYAMNPDGSGVTRLTDNRADDTQPAWFPDGTIGWLHQMGNSVLLWRMNADGSGAHVVARRSGPAMHLGWAASPDGKRVAITEQTGPRAVDLVIVDLTSGAEVRLGGDGVDELPAWSPDGAFIAWTSAQTGDPEVWVASADGRTSLRVTDRPGPDWLPRWLP